ncbi:astacin, partial [Ancylostoma caninum]
MRRVFYKAAQLWMNNTCINFFEDDKAEHRIHIGKGEGCWSMIGRNGGVQELSLGEGCDTVGTAAHELGHALGFFHPMSRHDRDKFLTINLATVRQDFIDQFNKESPLRNENYGMTYDFGSIMHYGATSASPLQKTTMVAYDTKYQRTMGSHLISFLDLSMMNEHYNCKAMCPKSTSAKCKNGGFPHPRNCKTCICPSGFGGDLCDQRVCFCDDSNEPI